MTGLSRTPLHRTARLEPGKPPQRKTPLQPVPWSRAVRPVGAGSGKGKSAAAREGGPGRAGSFPAAVAALIDARDPWCVHCGSSDGLQRHHRRGKGHGGDPRPHTDCACNGVRLCWVCHSWAHTSGRIKAEAEGLIIPRAAVLPFTLSFLFHAEEDGSGICVWPTCDGGWVFDDPAGAGAA